MEDFQTFVKRKSGFWISLNSGRKISLIKMNQSYIYEGLLAGFPDAKLNRSIIERVLEEAKMMLSYPSSIPYLIEPEICEIELPASFLHRLSDMDIGHERIPYVVCTALFSSSPVKKESDGSYCTLVWFQDKLALPIDKAIMERIKSFDWDAQAVDYTI